MRILLGLTEVSGFFARLKAGFDVLGIEATHVSLQPHRFAYSSGERLPLVVAWAQYCVIQRVRSAQGAMPVRAFWLAAAAATRLVLLAWALMRFDVFILGAGSSFFAFREFPLLRLLGKKIIYTLHGTDARPPYLDGFFDPSHYGFPAYDAKDREAQTPAEAAERLAAAHAAIAKRRCRRLRIIERNALAVVSGPSYSHFLSRKYIDFYAVGLPTSAIRAAPPEPCKSNDRVRILHAPSETRGKGTREIRAVIDALVSRGLPIDYVEISGRPHSEVIAEIARCDMVVDQYYSDTPMAAFAAEAALFGKPAVVGGYYSDSVGEHVPASYLPPTAFCRPEKLADTVAALVQDPAARANLGAIAQRYVTERWAPSTVASRFLQILDGAPPDWFIEPRQVVYAYGIGLSEAQARANVAALISASGPEALQLAHRPDLERMFVDFATGTQTPC